MKRTIIGTLLAAATLTANAGELDQLEAMTIQSPSEAAALDSDKIDARHVTAIYKHIDRKSDGRAPDVTIVEFTNIPCEMAKKPRDRGWKVVYSDSKSGETLLGCGDSMGLAVGGSVGYKVGRGLEGTVDGLSHDYQSTSLAWAINDALSKTKLLQHNKLTDEGMTFIRTRYGSVQ